MPTVAPPNRLAILAAVIAPLLWGTTWIAISEYMPPGHPLLAAALRALPAGLILLAIARRLPSGIWWWRAAVLGTLNFGIFFALLTVAAYRVPGGIGATMGALQPLMVVAISVPLLGLLPSVRQVVAGVVGIAGVALLVLGPEAALDPIGIASAIGAVASMAVALVLMKRWADPSVSALTTTAWQLVAGGLLLVPASLAFEGAPPAPTLDTVIAVAWVGLLGTGIANYLWFVGFEQITATQASFLTLIGPIVATGIGWIVLGQALTPVQMAGALIALGSVAAGAMTAVPSLRVAPRQRTEQPVVTGGGPPAQVVCVQRPD